jgi:hypothetical protein
MMDTLLEWMSYRSTGGRNAVREFLRDQQSEFLVLNRLSILGHVETAADHKWRVAPPVLAGLSRDGTASAVLCGARTPALLAQLKSACSNAGAVYHYASQLEGPAVITVEAKGPDGLQAVSEQTGIPLQHDAAFTMLACIPAIREWPGHRCGMVAGRVVSVHRFSRSELRWEPSSLDAANAARRGLFRIKRDWDTTTIRKRGPADLAAVEPAAGRMWVAAGQRVVRWDAQSRCFSLPRILFPPLLIARALALCTGALPARHADGRLTFPEVPARTARLAISLSGLRLA